MDKELWYIYTMEYYSTIKRNGFESVLLRWMNLEPIIQRKLNQKEKDKYHILTHTEDYWYQRIYLQGSNGETDIENKLTDTGRREERVRCMERVTQKLTLPYVNIANGNLLLCLRKLKQGLCINLEGWDAEGDGREVKEGGDICIPMADSC